MINDQPPSLALLINTMTLPPKSLTLLHSQFIKSWFAIPSPFLSQPKIIIIKSSHFHCNSSKLDPMANSNIKVQDEDQEVGFYDDGEEGGSTIRIPLLACESRYNSSLYDLEKAHLCSYKKDGVSFARSCFNATNALTGIGVLSMPYALSEGGWLSLVFFLLIAVIFCYTGYLIQKCMDADPAINSYVDIAEAAFGYKAKIIVAIIMCFELYMSGVSHLILEGDNLNNLFPNSSIQVFSVEIEGRSLFIIAAALVFLPTTWLRSLSVIAYFSAVGVFATFILFGALLWTGITETGFHAQGRLFNWSGLPMSLGLYSICFCGHAVFPTIYTSMKEASRFPKTLLISFGLGALSCGAVAILGYLMYGGDIQSQVTLNLPAGRAFSKIAIFTTLVTPFTKYAWAIMPIALAIEERFCVDGKGAPNVFLRTVMVLGTVTIALTVPSFEDIMAFIGSFLGISVSVLLPCLCYLRIFNLTARRNFESVKIILILVFGAVIAVFGTYASVKGMLTNL